MEKNRLEAFSDGVLAIVITIMILELKQPVGDGWSDLGALWPTLLAYFISFLFIAIYWINHHHTFHKVETVNFAILWCNIAWLFVMSFIPFAVTEAVGDIFYFLYSFAYHSAKALSPSRSGVWGRNP